MLTIQKMLELQKDISERAAEMRTSVLPPSLSLSRERSLALALSRSLSLSHTHMDISSDA